MASSAHVYLAGVRSLHILNDLPEPPTKLSKIKLAIKAMSEKGPPSTQKSPITYLLLCQLWGALSVIPDSIMYKAAVTLGFYAGLRGIEYMYNSALHDSLPPRISSVVFYENKNYFSYKVGKSKTQPHGFTTVVGCSGTKVCSNCTLLAYLKSRSLAGSLDKNSYLFVSSTGKTLSKYKPNLVIKRAVHALGRDASSYFAHSLIAGVAWTAAQLGFRDWEIKLLGGWESHACMGYVRDIASHASSYAARLSKQHSS